MKKSKGLMKFGMNPKGVEKELEEIDERVADLEHKQKAYFSGLFHDDLMETYGYGVSNLSEFFGLLEIENEEDFNKISTEKLDEQTKKYTTFGSFEQMKIKAGELYMMKYLRSLN